MGAEICSKFGLRLKGKKSARIVKGTPSHRYDLQDDTEFEHDESNKTFKQMLQMPFAPLLILNVAANAFPLNVAANYAKAVRSVQFVAIEEIFTVLKRNLKLTEMVEDSTAVLKYNSRWYVV